MRTPKLAVASAAVLIALAGCGQTNGSGSGGDNAAAAATTAPADPTERVNAAGRKLSTSSFKFSIDSAGIKGDGVRHQPSNSMSMKFAAEAEGQKVTIEMVQIDKDMYMKLDFGDLGDDPVSKEMAAALGGWQHITSDEAASTVGGLAKTGADAIGTDMIKGSSNIKETAPGTFTGTVDLSKTTDLDFTDEGTVEALGDKAKAVPVTFTLDGEDRLSSIAIEVPATGSTKAQKMTVKFSDFDKVDQPKAPPADQIKKK